MFYYCCLNTRGITQIPTQNVLLLREEQRNKTDQGGLIIIKDILTQRQYNTIIYKRKKNNRKVEIHLSRLNLEIALKNKG